MVNLSLITLRNAFVYIEIFTRNGEASGWYFDCRWCRATCQEITNKNRSKTVASLTIYLRFNKLKFRAPPYSKELFVSCVSSFMHFWVAFRFGIFCAILSLNVYASFMPTF